MGLFVGLKRQQWDRGVGRWGSGGSIRRGCFIFLRTPSMLVINFREIFFYAHKQVQSARYYSFITLFDRGVEVSEGWRKKMCVCVCVKGREIDFENIFEAVHMYCRCLLIFLIIVMLYYTNLNIILYNDCSFVLTEYIFTIKK